MTCAHCGTVGAADGRWCPQCYLPYTPLAAHASPPRTGMPWQAPSPPPPPPSFTAAQAQAPSPYAASPSYQQSFTPTPGYPGALPGAPADRFGMPVDSFATPGNPFAAPPMLPGGPPPGGWPAKLGLVLPQSAVEVGDLPRICVISGRPTDKFVKRRWIWASNWLAVLIIIGVIPLFLVRELVGDKVAGYLPVHPLARRRYRLQAGGLFLAGTGLFVAGAEGQQDGLIALGLLVIVGSLVPLAVYGNRVHLRRAAPGFLAMKKAHPAFQAAFARGKQPGERPYASAPARYNSGLRVAIYGVLTALIVVGSYTNGVAGASRCSGARLHPNRAAVNNAFAESRSNVARINASGALTQQSADQLAAEHQRLIGDLQAVHLSSNDRQAVDGYAAELILYDQQVQAALQMNDLQSANNALHTANAGLDGASQQLQDSLHSIPGDCLT